MTRETRKFSYSLKGVLFVAVTSFALSSLFLTPLEVSAEVLSGKNKPILKLSVQSDDGQNAKIVGRLTFKTRKRANKTLLAKCPVIIYGFLFDDQGNPRQSDTSKPFLLMNKAIAHGLKSSSKDGSSRTAIALLTPSLGANVSLPAVPDTSFLQLEAVASVGLCEKGKTATKVFSDSAIVRIGCNGKEGVTTDSFISGLNSVLKNPHTSYR